MLLVNVQDGFRLGLRYVDAQDWVRFCVRTKRQGAERWPEEGQACPEVGALGPAFLKVWPVDPCIQISRYAVKCRFSRHHA